VILSSAAADVTSNCVYNNNAVRYMEYGSHIEVCPLFADFCPQISFKLLDISWIQKNTKQMLSCIVGQ
jgi:hypothetical protein